MTKIVLDIESCSKCPFFKTGNQWSTDGWDRMEDWICTKTATPTVIQGSVEWHEESKIKVPSWCPIKVDNIGHPKKKMVYKFGESLFQKEENIIDIESKLDKILYEDSTHKICLIGNEVYLTSDYLAMTPKNHVKQLTETYISGEIDVVEYKTIIHKFTNIYEEYKKYVNNEKQDND